MSSIRLTGAARTWLECLPLGDGRMGVMTDGGVTRTTLHLNDAGAWSGSPDSEGVDGFPDSLACARLLSDARAAIDAGDPVAAESPLQGMQTRYAQSFLPLGTVVVDVAEPEGGPVERALDLRSGVHRATDGRLRTTTFLVESESVLVHVISAPVSVTVALHSPLRAPDGAEPTAEQNGDATALLLRLPSDVAPGHEPDLPAARWDHGSVEAAVVSRVVRHADRTIVLVATATTFTGPGARPLGTAQDAYADAVARTDRVATGDIDTLQRESCAGMHALLDSVVLRLDAPSGTESEEHDTATRFAAARADPRGVAASDPGLVALLFDFGRYLLVCSSRPGGLPANLQGLWNADMRPPWGSGYTLNINTEMNYWGAHVTDLSSRAAPLTDFTIALATAASSHTRRLYGVAGWTVHHNTDAWLYATTPGRGTGDPRWSFWPLGGAWLASQLTESWRFGASAAEELAHVWPTLRGAAEFLLEWHRDGSTSPATSPENAFITGGGRSASLVRTSTMDLALVRTTLDRTVETATALGLAEDAVAAAAAERLGNLPSQPTIGADGGILEWESERTEEDPRHRHLSPLFGLFPGEEEWDPAHRAAAAETLNRRGDDSSGWSLMWKMALWARLGRPDRVDDLLALALRDADDARGPWAGGLYPNLFAAHPPFQIDANLGFVGAFTEALLQSHDDIRLLPALPSALSTGSVTGLVARPGITVDIAWRGARLVEARLRARHDGAAGAHRVHWNGRSIVARISTTHETVLDPRSFPTEEVHP